MTVALGIGILVTGGVYLLLQRGLVRVIFGFVLLGHAANLLLLSSGGTWLREAAIVGTADPERMADPLPQAFVLTAIVITFGVTVYLLALAGSEHGSDDDTERSR
ncbi:multicomponent Na+:H+ antiporter subunit C [Lipingzhangella halophila]|uniref:Multicomponent Na+:H+ antiporter subunit C n=1 Tax=Lipingzhangella halophila TaxID=1783352 RepID=A0A7W7RCG9_9ACTN|nr:NADH-quinone oxidoreductase subunit K [Lipingzhangella halophila]MBB4929448.1 multicomponent Na+:H+ antiporter subunit C [Lipingzhangella halophila]